MEVQRCRRRWPAGAGAALLLLLSACTLPGGGEEGADGGATDQPGADAGADAGRPDAGGSGGDAEPPADGGTGDGGTGDGDGDGGVADGGTDAGATDVPCDGGTAESGAATFYEPASATACGLPAEGDYVALPPGLFAGSRGCGACIEVTGPRGVRVARAVDLCAGCAPDELDLARATFAALEAPEQGRISVTYRFVPCEVSGPVSYRVAEGSDPSRLALQVRDHRYAVASLELRPSGGSAFTPLERTQDNLFVHPSASGPLALPATLRVTDVHGHVLTDTLDSVEPGRTVAGAAQFPATCGP